MRSVARRSSLGQSPAPRSRSAERSMRQPGEGIILDFDSEMEGVVGTGSFDRHDDRSDDDEDIYGASAGAKNSSNHHTPPSTHLSHGSSHENRVRLASDSSLSKIVRSHRRAMSDPFDTADSGGVTDGLVLGNDDGGLMDEQINALPTLQRYPYAASQNKNCWSEPPVDIFYVRGSNYLNDRKKSQAKEYLLQARGCDLFLSDNPSKCKIASLKGALGGSLRRKASLLIRLTFPWGLLIQYYEVPDKFVPFMRPGASRPSMTSFTPAEKCLANWLGGDRDYKNQRLKLISYVCEGPWIVRNMVTGKPALIGTKLPVKYTYTPKEGSKQDFLECDLDIGNSSATAKRIVSVCRRYMSALSVDIGFVIEGKKGEELPEEMMGAIRVHEVDPMTAPTIH